MLLCVCRQPQTLERRETILLLQTSLLSWTEGRASGQLLSDIANINIMFILRSYFHILRTTDAKVLSNFRATNRMDHILIVKSNIFVFNSNLCDTKFQFTTFSHILNVITPETAVLYISDVLKLVANWRFQSHKNLMPIFFKHCSSITTGVVDNILLEIVSYSRYCSLIVHYSALLSRYFPGCELPLEFDALTRCKRKPVHARRDTMSYKMTRTMPILSVTATVHV